MAEYWGLAAYPPPATWLQSLSATLDGPLRVTTLRDLRTLGATGIVRQLRSVHADVGLLLHDAGAGPMVPALHALLALTRCPRLEAVDEAGVRRTITRRGGVAALGRVATATVRGLAIAWLCARELRALERMAAPGAPADVRRIAVLRTNLWFGLKAGGSVGHFAGVVNALARRGIAVEIIAPEIQPMIDPGVPQRVVSGPSEPAYPYELNNYTFHRAFARDAAPLVERMRPDAVYHRLSLGCWAGLTLARRFNLPLILEYNGSEVWVSRHWGRRLRFERLATRGEDVALRGADVVTVVSQPLADELVARGVPPERIVVHPNGVDTSLFDPGRFSAEQSRARRAELGIASDALLCTFVGTFGPWHGVNVLADAIRMMADRDREWIDRARLRFLLIGDGALMPQVRRALEPYSSLVTFSGLRPQDETPSWLAASDILLSPHVPNADGSKFFGSPTKLFEYMAMGKAIVASALEQIGEVLRPAYDARALPDLDCGPNDPHVAIVTTPGSVDELVAGIRFLAEHAACRERLGANARRLAVARYTWDANVDALLARCRELSAPRTRVVAR
jgi:glycosyltransferase involved in cell wall biosynthesis